ncbi:MULTISPECIES: hypothetical protein [unclassified Microbulbifer]|uniref:hypothetical protein n=1 Tax=unclassified Microbulbifer TaxID=2619833 RepID=UPI0027E578BA|nr:MULTISPECIES: hypothetical protein [unclassified Microbulbifer]
MAAIGLGNKPPFIAAMGGWPPRRSYRVRCLHHLGANFADMVVTIKASGDIPHKILQVGYLAE